MPLRIGHKILRRGSTDVMRARAKVTIGRESSPTKGVDVARTIREARFLSQVERAFQDAVLPLGLFADRELGLRIDRHVFQPAIAIMPLRLAVPDAYWHEDFRGAVFLTSTGTQVERFRALADLAMSNPTCRFAALVQADERRVDLWTGGAPVSLFSGDRLVVEEFAVPVDALYERPSRGRPTDL